MTDVPGDRDEPGTGDPGERSGGAGEPDGHVEQASAVVELDDLAGTGAGVQIPGFHLRREAREDALAVLYESEMSGCSAADALGGRGVVPSRYAILLAEGVERSRDRLDDLLGRHLIGWRVERLGVLDRALARMAAWELMHRPDVPTGVVLSEAVALATQYCGSESPRFLNGVLRAVADEVRDESEQKRRHVQHQLGVAGDQAC